ncbi:nickel/cobalt transporter [Rhodopseudomonas palustris]
MTKSRGLLFLLSAALATFSLAHAASASPFRVPHPASGLPGSELTSWIFAEQAKFYRSLSAHIRASKQDGAARWGLFAISFLYGILHAAGPGHGKAVISSYLVANRETWRRGVVLSFASAGLQSVVAVIIVTVAAVVLDTTAAAIGSTVHIVEIVSYLLVIAIGLRLLYVKGRAALIAWRDLGLPRALAVAPASFGGASLSMVAPAAFDDASLKPSARQPMTMTIRPGQCQVAGCSADIHGFHCGDEHDHHQSAWGHAHAPDPAELAGAGGWRRGLSAMVVVGLRPCSGAIIVLVFALAQDLFWTGVGATLLMGLGTALTVTLIASLAVTAREVASRIAEARAGFGMLTLRAIEVAASAVIVVFGLLLLTGYMATEQLWMFAG